ncbi:DUF4276 family protein [Sphingopyxis sp.]|uniref:DUF4276 family protein n=1 Tax=Sphingopyxis sp. TaxID=1908224 RepID=UPI003D0D49A8
MTRLLVHVEGQTEETFVNEVLAPHLYDCGYNSVGARLLGNSRMRSKRGGISDWKIVRREIDRHLAEDGGAIATTFVDYYALPEQWPGRQNAPSLPIDVRAAHVQEQVAADFSAFSPRHQRFEPFVVLHEFEALLFSDCKAFGESIGHANKVEQLQMVRDAFPCPEHINDSPQTAPSKRVCTIIPGYEKVIFGNVAALSIGLDTMRATCPHFEDWLSRLEGKLLQGVA